jgi:hypothetical protein
MGATSPALHAKVLSILRWLMMPGLRSGRNWTDPTSRTLQGNRSLLAKLLNHKTMVMLPLYLLPRNLWCEVTFPHCPNSPPTSLLLRDPLRFPIWDREPVLFWTCSYLQTHQDKSHQLLFELIAGLELQIHAVRSSPSFFSPTNHNGFRTYCWPLRQRIKSGTIWSLILVCFTIDDSNYVKSWNNESPLLQKSC